VSSARCIAPTQLYLDALITQVPVPRRPGLLIIAGNTTLRIGLAVYLEGSGLAVWTADSGREAVYQLLAHSGEIDAVLLDAGPLGPSAPALLTRLRRSFPDVACCLLTEHPDGGEAEAARAAGVEVIARPVRLARLKEELWGLVLAGVEG